MPTKPFSQPQTSHVLSVGLQQQSVQTSIPQSNRGLAAGGGLSYTASSSISASDIGQQLGPLETQTERLMVDTDNVLFQAKKQGGYSYSAQTQKAFKELENGLKLTKNQVDDLEFRLDEMGVTCGGATQAFAFKQRIDKLNQ